jgi:hypothetical protein
MDVENVSSSSEVEAQNALVESHFSATSSTGKW